jgi:hypothetical protein
VSPAISLSADPGMRETAHALDALNTDTKVSSNTIVQ